MACLVKPPNLAKSTRTPINKATYYTQINKGNKIGLVKMANGLITNSNVTF
jgi:hypothetical protein